MPELTRDDYILLITRLKPQFDSLPLDDQDMILARCKEYNIDFEAL